MKTKPWDARLAHALVRPLARTPVHPNAVTSVGLGVGLAAAACYAAGGRMADAGAALYLASAVLDHADGELARLTGKASAFGHKFDRAADLAVKLSLFTAMGFGLRSGRLGAFAVVAGAVAGAALLAIFSMRSALARRRGPAAFEQAAWGGFEIEDILYVIAPCTWLGWLEPFVVATAIGAPTFALWVAVQLYRARGGAPRVPRLTALAYPGLVVGVALFSGLVAYHGARDVAAAVAVAGWGLLGVAAFHVIPLIADAAGWSGLLPRALRPGFGTIVFGRWLGESVNTLLPALQIGGNVVKARFLARHGVPAAVAGASVVVDVTLLVGSMVVFALVGLGLLAVRLDAASLALPAALGVAIMAALVGGFWLLQHRGLFATLAGTLRRMTRGPAWAGLVADAGGLDAAIVRLYQRRSAIVAAGTWHLFSWVLGAGEVWLALRLLGHPVDVLTAVLLESLGQAVRAAAFAVPGALGVQEGAFVVLGSALALPADAALALSLTKRVRELLLGVPGLLAWQLSVAATRWHTVPRP